MNNLGKKLKQQPQSASKSVLNQGPYYVILSLGLTQKIRLLFGYTWTANQSWAGALKLSLGPRLKIPHKIRAQFCVFFYRLYRKSLSLFQLFLHFSPSFSDMDV